MSQAAGDAPMTEWFLVDLLVLLAVAVGGFTAGFAAYEVWNWKR